MAVDNRLQHLSNSKSAVVVLFAKARSPLSPLGVARVVDIENKLQRSQSFRIKTLDSTLKIMPDSFDDAGPLERVLHMLAERHASHDKGLELADKVRGGLLKVAIAYGRIRQRLRGVLRERIPLLK